MFFYKYFNVLNFKKLNAKAGETETIIIIILPYFFNLNIIFIASIDLEISAYSPI